MASLAVNFRPWRISRSSSASASERCLSWSSLIELSFRRADPSTRSPSLVRRSFDSRTEYAESEVGHYANSEECLPGTDFRSSQMAKANLLSPSGCFVSVILWRVAVHRLQPAVGEGKGRRHIHFATHDFDIGPGFAGARGLHRFIEFAERGHTRRDTNRRIRAPSAIRRSSKARGRCRSSSDSLPARAR